MVEIFSHIQNFRDPYFLCWNDFCFSVFFCRLNDKSDGCFNWWLTDVLQFRCIAKLCFMNKIFRYFKQSSSQFGERKSNWSHVQHMYSAIIAPIDKYLEHRTRYDRWWRKHRWTTRHVRKMIIMISGHLKTIVFASVKNLIFNKKIMVWLIGHVLVQQYIGIGIIWRAHVKAFAFYLIDQFLTDSAIIDFTFDNSCTHWRLFDGIEIKAVISVLKVFQPR